MRNLKIILIVGLIFMALSPLYAGPLLITQEDGTDIFNVSALIAAVSPLITLVVSWIVIKIAGVIPGTWKLAIVAVLSAVLAWLAEKASAPDLPVFAQFGINLAATFIHQFVTQYQAEKKAKQRL